MQSRIARYVRCAGIVGVLFFLLLFALVLSPLHFNSSSLVAQEMPVQVWPAADDAPGGGERVYWLPLVSGDKAYQDATALALGASHSCALTTAGGVMCWGSNSSGQLGDGTSTARATPAFAKGLTSGVQAIASGNEHSCALTTAGGVMCWGNNLFGQIGNNSTGFQTSPADVVGLTSGVQAIAAGGAHTCAITARGGVVCWGLNNYGQLGDNGSSTQRTPVQVAGLTSGVRAIVTGEYHSCALTAAGGMKCWGADSRGQLGNDASDASHATPVDVFGLRSGVVGIAAAANHTCAIVSDETLKCWGLNGNGQAGSGAPASVFLPQEVAGIGAGVLSVNGDFAHTCALTVEGSALCWGNNDFGQLGDDTKVSRHAPAQVAGLVAGVRAVDAGRFHSCALMTNGVVKCWGRNMEGQLGNESTPEALVPMDVVGFQ